jgi:hypothetical protein
MNIQLNDRQRKRIIGIIEVWMEDERDMWEGDEEEYDGNFEEDMASARAMVEVLEGKTGQEVPQGRWGP